MDDERRDPTYLMCVQHRTFQPYLMAPSPCSTLRRSCSMPGPACSTPQPSCSTPQPSCLTPLMPGLPNSTSLCGAALAAAMTAAVMQHRPLWDARRTTAQSDAIVGEIEIELVSLHALLTSLAGVEIGSEKAPPKNLAAGVTTDGIESVMVPPKSLAAGTMMDGTESETAQSTKLVVGVTMDEMTPDGKAADASRDGLMRNVTGVGTRGWMTGGGTMDGTVPSLRRRCPGSQDEERVFAAVGASVGAWT